MGRKLMFTGRYQSSDELSKATLNALRAAGGT